MHWSVVTALGLVAESTTSKDSQHDSEFCFTHSDDIPGGQAGVVWWRGCYNSKR